VAALDIWRPGGIITRSDGSVVSRQSITEYNNSGSSRWWLLASFSTTAGAWWDFNIKANLSRISNTPTEIELNIAYGSVGTNETRGDVGNGYVQWWQNSTSGVYDMWLYVNSFTLAVLDVTLLGQVSSNLTPSWTTTAPSATGTYTKLLDTLITSKFTILTGGNVGIGRTPDYKLDVNGAIRSSQLALVGYTNIVNRRPIYIATTGSPLSLSLTNTVGTSAYIIFNYGPFGYAIPTVATGATRYYRMYMVYSDNGTVGSFALQYNFDGGGGSQQYSFGTTYGGGAGTNYNRDSYSQNVTIQSGNHGTLYVVLTQNVFPNGGGNWGITIQYIELQALDVY
jgi:hypothetical protein